MLNKELLLVSKHDYTLVYRLEEYTDPHTSPRCGYDNSKFGQILYNDVEANTSPDKHWEQWEAFEWFFYYLNTDRTSIELKYLGTTGPGSPRVIINGTQYQTDHGLIYLYGDPFDLVGLYKTGSPLYLNITWP